MPTTKSSLALDDTNHDLFLDSNGQIAFYADTVSRIKQAIRCRLQTVQGEWYQNPDIGVPFFDEVAVKNPNLVTLKHLFTSVISGVDGVKTVDSIDLSFSQGTRVLYITFAVTATDGTTVTGGV